MNTSKLGVVIAVLGLAACGGSDDNGHGTLGLALSPNAITVPLGESRTIAVALARSSSLAGRPVALAVTGEPAGITATFDDVSPTGDSATLTLAADPAAALTTATLSVTASADGTSAEATASVTIGDAAPFTVSGTAIFSNGAAVANATVRVWSKGATTSLDSATDGLGAFTVANVRAPYDVSLETTNDTQSLFVGLTSATPALGITSTFGGGSGMTISGTVTGGAAGLTTYVTAFTGTDVAAQKLSDDDEEYALELSPPAGSSASAKVSALQYTSNADGPTAYVGFAESTAGVTAAGPNIANLTPTLPTGSRSVTLSLANAVPSSSTYKVQLAWLPTELTSVGLVNKTIATGTESLNVVVSSDPRIPMAVAIIAVTPQGTAVRAASVGTSASTFDMTLVPPLAALSPADGSVDATDATAIAVSSIADATYVFYLSFAGSAIEVITREPSVQLSSLRSRGVPLPGATPIAWQGLAFYDGPPVDEAVALTVARVFHAETASYSGTTERTFQVAP